MEEDWDLQAVVRGCASATTMASATTTAAAATTSGGAGLDLHGSSCFSPFGVVEDHLLCFPDPFETRREVAVEELHDLYRPFFPKSQPLSPRTIPISSLSVIGGGGFSEQTIQTHQIQQPQKQEPPSSSKHTHAGSAASTVHSQSPRSKRRKNQMKNVCHIPAEGLSSDMWAWRKYGQKPIKGSPYPRGYYRCSSSKGCLARKQVERNRSDPDMFIVTYTAEHNHPMPTHRNSLAGSTRQKPATSPAAASMASGDAAKPSAKPSCSSPATSADEELVQQSTSVQSKDVVEDEEDDELGFPDMVVDDDFFMGLDELAGQVAGDCFSDHCPPSFSLPWLASNAATAAGGI